jgi:hypothetical protein
MFLLPLFMHTSISKFKRLQSSTPLSVFFVFPCDTVVYVQDSEDETARIALGIAAVDFGQLEGPPPWQWKLKTGKADSVSPAAPELGLC